MRQEENTQAAGRNTLRGGDELLICNRIVGGAQEIAQPFDAGAGGVLPGKRLVASADYMRALGLPLASGFGIDQRLLDRKE